MITLSRELNEITHPLVKSFHLKQDFGTSDKIQKRLVIETRFSFTDTIENKPKSELMDLLIDLQNLLDRIEQQTGKLDCIDIRPLQKSRQYPSRIAA